MSDSFYTAVSNKINNWNNSCADYLYSNFKPFISSYFWNHIDNVYELFSKNQKDLIDKMSKNKKQLNVTWVRLFLDKFNDESKKQLLEELAEDIFGPLEEETLQIFDGQCDDKILSRLVSHNKENDGKAFFDFLGIQYDTIENDIKDYKKKTEIKNEQREIEALREKNKEFEVKLKQLSNENKDLNKTIRKYDGLSKEIVELREEIKNKDQTIVNLKKDVSDANNSITSLSKNNKELVDTIEKLKSSGANKEITKEDKPNLLDSDILLSDIEERFYLGTINPRGINIEKNNMVINPYIPIDTSITYVNVTKFKDSVKYKGEYSTYLQFIDKDFIELFFPELKDSFFYKSSIEKYNLLSDKFINKTIVYKPKFVAVHGENKKSFNADIVNVYDNGDFSNSVFIPRLTIDSKKLKGIVDRGNEIIINHFPITLTNSLKYVWVENNIYEIDYMPAYIEPLKRKIWKQNSNAFRKIELPQKGVDCIEITDTRTLEVVGMYAKRMSLVMGTEHKKSDGFSEEGFIKNICNNAQNNYLCYSEEEIKNFHISLKTSSLVILAGPSGIGKTRLPIIYSSSLGLSEDNTVLFVPISPSFLEPEDVLGYIKPLRNGNTGDGNGDIYNSEYMESSSGLVSFLKRASENPDRMYIVIFDEMNLSQVEHWFSPFISILEKDLNSRKLVLYSDKLKVSNEDDYPSTILIGKNVFFVGTINIDETTKTISDRLLDRAITIRLEKSSLEDLKRLPSGSKELYPEIPFSTYETTIVKQARYFDEFDEDERNFINDLDNCLKSSFIKKEISFRTINKIASYLANSKGVLERKVAFDYTIKQMIVDNINGTKEELSDLFGNNESKSILSVINKYANVSDFLRTKRAIDVKTSDLDAYGYTR